MACNTCLGFFCLVGWLIFLFFFPFQTLYYINARILQITLIIFLEHTKPLNSQKGARDTVVKMKGMYKRQVCSKGEKHLEFSSMSYIFHFTDVIASAKPETYLHATKTKIQ